MKQKLLIFCNLFFILGAIINFMYSDVETLVSFDNENKVFFLDQKLLSNFEYFKKYGNVEMAFITMDNQSNFSLQLILKENNIYNIQKFNIDQSLLYDIRINFNNYYNSLNKNITSQETYQVLVTNSAKPFLLTVSTLLGLGFYGWALPWVVFNTTNTLLNVLSYSLTAGVSFITPFILIPEYEVTFNKALSYTIGAFYGIIHGGLLNFIFMPDTFNLIGGIIDRTRSLLAFSMTGSIIESIAAYYLQNIIPMGSGDLFLNLAVNSHSMFFSYGVLSLISTNELTNSKLVAATLLGGSITGILGGYFLSKIDHFTDGDAYFIANITKIGYILGLSIVELFKTPVYTTNIMWDDQGNSYTNYGKEYIHPSISSYMSSIMIGGTLAMGLGFYLVNNKDFTLEHTLYTFLATTAADIIGGAFGVWVFENPYLPTAILESITYGIMYYIYKDQAEKKNNLTSKNNPNFYVNFDILSLYSGINEKNKKFFYNQDKFLTIAFNF